MVCDPNSLCRSHVISELEIGHRFPSRSFHLSSKDPDWPLPMGQGCCPCSGEVSDDLKPPDGACVPCRGHTRISQPARGRRWPASGEDGPLPLRPPLALLLQERERAALGPPPGGGRTDGHMTAFTSSSCLPSL